MEQRISIFLSFAESDAKVIAPLAEELEWLAEYHTYLDVFVQQHDRQRRTRRQALTGNAAALQRCDLLWVFVSPDYFRDPLYRRYLRADPSWHQRKRVRLFLTRPCGVSNEPFLRTPSPEWLQAVPLARMGEDREDFFQKLVDELGGPGWVLVRTKEERSQRALAERQSREVKRRRYQKLFFYLLTLITSFSLGTAYLYWLNRPPPPAGMLPGEGPAGPGADTAYTPAPFLLPPAASGYPQDEGRFPIPGSTQESPPASAAHGNQSPPDSALTDSRLPIRTTGDLAGRAEGGSYEARYQVGDGRFAGKLHGGMGWRLLDADGRPVVDTVFRRMYHQPGFVNGKMKVKMGDETFYIDPDGRRTP